MDEAQASFSIKGSMYKTLTTYDVTLITNAQRISWLQNTSSNLKQKIAPDKMEYDLKKKNVDFRSLSF